jgi:TIGR03009 family protein
MSARIGLWMAVGLLTVTAPAAAQTQYRQRYAPPPQPSTRTQRPPYQGQYRPARPPYRVAERQAPAPQGQPPAARPEPVLPAPFTLTPQEDALVDRVLQEWERRSADVKTFACKFTRFDWNLVYGRPDQPAHVVQGEIKYEAPDKGMLRVDGELVDFQWVNSQAVGGRLAKGQRAEHWVCNGASIFKHDFQAQQLIEYRLPPEMRGQTLSEGPLPFLFGAEAGRLKERYFLRIVTPANVQGQVWLEAYPRFQTDAADFHHATLILTLDEMEPFALRIVMPDGKQWQAYRFLNPKVNAWNPLDPLGVFGRGRWAKPSTPSGWTKIVEDVPPLTQQAARPSNSRPRR